MGHRARTVEAVAMTVWNQKRFLLTGHTGFKGAWAARWLAHAGAQVTGLSLAPDQTPNLFDILGQAHLAQSHLVDLRDTAAVAQVVAAARPEIVLHMAAQPLVRQGYADPVGTFSSNVMGTVHLLDALRHTSDLRAVLVVTSDKVYENSGAHVALTETDRLGGADPYSASKAATEIVVAAMRQAFFQASGVRVATARGGQCGWRRGFFSRPSGARHHPRRAKRPATCPARPQCHPALAACFGLPVRLLYLCRGAVDQKRPP